MSGRWARELERWEGTGGIELWLEENGGCVTVGELVIETVVVLEALVGEAYSLAGVLGSCCRGREKFGIRGGDVTLRWIRAWGGDKRVVAGASCGDSIELIASGWPSRSKGGGGKDS